MASHGQIYKNISGTVIEIVNRYKAILEINGPDSKQRAMLRVEKLTCKSDINPDGSEDHAISDFVKVGYVLRCRCHKYSETEDHNCAWFIAEVLSIHHEMADPQMLTGLCPNMVNKIGWISHLDKRQGVISVKENESEIQHDVLFLASKVYDGGKRIKVKHPLHEFVSINDKVNFDAVPINPEENDNHCAWFATLVWKKSKPLIDYNSTSKEPDPNLGKIKTIIKNPHSQFIRGKGQILQILSEEYGVALGAVNDKQNHWQSLLFHRSCASLFKFNLGKTNLQEVFKEGDKIRFIAALAPKGFSAQWVASHVSVDVVGEARSLVESI